MSRCHCAALVSLPQSVASEHDCYFIPAVTVALSIYLFPLFKPRETRTNGSRIKASQPHTFMRNITATKQAR